MLAGILLRTDERGLHLAAFDYETAATTRVDAEIADDGTDLVSGRLLNEICKTLPKSAEVDIELSGSRLLITSRTAQFTLPTVPVEEYPQLPGVPDTVFTAQADALADAVAQVAVAASTEENLPVLTAVQLLLEDARITLAATDRYRFAVRELTVQPTGTLPAVTPRTGTKKDKTDDGAVLIPAKFLAEATRAMTGEHPVAIGWSDGQLTLTTAGSSIGTRLLDGDFPRHRRVFPTLAGAELTVTVPTDEALAALKRVALVASDKTPVRLTVSDDGQQLLLEAGHGDDAHAVDRIPCNTTGYLADALKALAVPEARLHATSATKPALLTGHCGERADTDYQHLLMPIRLNG